MLNNNKININDAYTGVKTPINLQGQQVTTTILKTIISDTNTNDDAEPNAK
jgi:hypothetical protein